MYLDLAVFHLKVILDHTVSLLRLTSEKKSCYHFFEARLSLKEKVEGHRENAAGGLGASLSIQFPSLPTRLSIYNHEI